MLAHLRDSLRNQTSNMHQCLNVDEILRLFACELIAAKAKGTAVSLACCRKSFQDPVLDVLWESQNRLLPLLKSLPGDVWKVDGQFTFERIPTKAEWAVLQKHARRMRKLTVDASRDPVTSDVLFVLQVRTIKEPFLPKLKTFKCENADEGFIPFIPTLLSRTATSIDIEFTEDTPTLTVASIVTRLSILCPDLEYIILNDLPKDPAITEAVSEMLLACNRNALQCFYADSLLTEEARNVLFQLPKLCYLWVVIQGRTLLPPVALPNLYTIDVEFGDHLDWLQGFRGIMSGNLRNVYFTSDSEQIGDFLDEFKNVALTTSVPAVLQEFKFHTPHSWNPSYRSLLPFTQLRELLIEFSCENGCSSRLDDNIIFDLTRAMPELRILQLGGSPCRTGGRVTIRGLIALAGNCRLLSKLCIHFQTPSLVAMARFGVTISPDKTVVLRQDCALTDLEVGELPISGDDAAVLVTMALLQIFPRLYNIEFTGGRWENVLEFIRATRRLGSFIQVINDNYGIRAPEE